MLGLPVIQNLEDLSIQTHISVYTIYQLSTNAHHQYKTYEIPKKKSGEKRIISQPSKKLKGLQSWILVNILNKVQVSSSCKGFKKGSSILENASPHKGAYSILTLDLKDFFPSVKSKQVFNIFKTLGYNNLISTVFTNICTYNNCLPQGGPCSPTLANLSAWTLDLRIQGFVGKRGIKYTRYADDLTFSGLNPSTLAKIIPMIKSIIEDENFSINDSKTRLAGPARAKVVTGLIIHDDKIGIGRKKYKELRRKIYHLTFPSEQENSTLLSHIQGWLSYLNSVDKARLKKAEKYIKTLSERHPNTLVTQIIS